MGRLIAAALLLGVVAHPAGAAPAERVGTFTFLDPATLAPVASPPGGTYVLAASGRSDPFADSVELSRYVQGLLAGGRAPRAASSMELDEPGELALQEAAAVPEPAGVAVFGAGLAMLVLWRGFSGWAPGCRRTS